MTPTLCLTQCQKLGFTYGGTEYSDEVGPNPSIRTEERSADRVVLLRQLVRWKRWCRRDRLDLQHAVRR
jgi:hypothetical protein